VTIAHHRSLSAVCGSGVLRIQPNDCSLAAQFSVVSETSRPGEDLAAVVVAEKINFLNARVVIEDQVRLIGVCR
jgi:hypothetical protein